MSGNNSSNSMRAVWIAGILGVIGTVTAAIIGLISVSMANRGGELEAAKFEATSESQRATIAAQETHEKGSVPSTEVTRVIVQEVEVTRIVEVIQEVESTRLIEITLEKEVPVTVEVTREVPADQNQDADFSDARRIWPECVLINHVQPSNNKDEVDMIVEKIEVDEFDRMKWTVSFWNQSESDYHVGFSEEQITVTDLSDGTTYTLKSTNASNSQLPAFQRLSFEFYFDVPPDQVNRFAFRHSGFVMGYTSNSVSFEDVLIAIDFSSTCGI